MRSRHRSRLCQIRIRGRLRWGLSLLALSPQERWLRPEPVIQSLVFSSGGCHSSLHTNRQQHTEEQRRQGNMGLRRGNATSRTKRNNSLYNCHRRQTVQEAWTCHPVCQEELGPSPCDRRTALPLSGQRRTQSTWLVVALRHQGTRRSALA